MQINNIDNIMKITDMTIQDIFYKLSNEFENVAVYGGINKCITIEVLNVLDKYSIGFTFIDGVFKFRILHTEGLHELTWDKANYVFNYICDKAKI